MGRSHPRCWAGDRYEHHCHQPSGRTCVERGCDQAAGTPWTPLWCPEHDVERLDRISAGLKGIAASLHATATRERTDR